MAKKESQESKPKKGLPRLMELAMTEKAPMMGGMILSALATVASFLPYLAIYFIIQEIVGVYPDFGALEVPKVLGYSGLALGGVLLNVLLYTAFEQRFHPGRYENAGNPCFVGTHYGSIVNVSGECQRGIISGGAVPRVG